MQKTKGSNNQHDTPVRRWLSVVSSLNALIDGDVDHAKAELKGVIDSSDFSLFKWPELSPDQLARIEAIMAE